MALDTHVVWEMRDSASNDNGGGTRWVALVEAGTYKWTASGNEFYVELAGGGDPSLTEPKAVTTDGTYVSDTNGTLGSLNVGEWDWGDNDALGYSTVYVRLDDGADPDTKNDKFVSMVFGGGVDYSMQDASQLNLADGACVIASTTFTSATGGFTALMVGNILYVVSGTNEVIDWYEIVAYTDTNTITIDKTACDGVGNATGITFNVGGARVLPVDAHFEAWTAGNKMYMEAGTYTLGASVIVALDGTATAMMKVEGYNSTRGDAPVGNDRPLIAAAANQLTFDNFWEFRHLRDTTLNATGFRADLNAVFVNCKSENSSGTGARTGFTAFGLMFDCEGVSTNGIAFSIAVNGSYAVFCYAHDSVGGFFTNSSFLSFIECIIDTMSGDGIEVAGAESGTRVKNCTIYNVTGTGILDDGNAARYINNLLDNCGVGISNSVSLKENTYADYNNYNGNTKDTNNVNKGPNATANVPGFAGAAGGNFSDVDSADGFGMRLGVGA